MNLICDFVFYLGKVYENILFADDTVTNPKDAVLYWKRAVVDSVALWDTNLAYLIDVFVFFEGIDT